jgi:hypothetical protein
MQALRGFDLENEPLIDDHVERLRGKWLAPMIYHDGDLAIDPMIFGHQVSFESECVEVFPESEAKRSVDIVKGCDDRVRQCLLEQTGLRI